MAAPVSRIDGIEQVDAATAHQAMRDGAVLIDVREPLEWRVARIPGALHVPLSALAERVHELPRDRPLVLQCAAGARSQAAAAWLQAQGFEVANLAHGIQGWHHAGLPLED